MNFLVFAASHRKESINRKLAYFAAGMAKGQGIKVDFAEYTEFDMPAYDDETYRENAALPDAVHDFVMRLKKADGIVIACPEYNWSFPGSLKNIIDWASAVTPNPFAGKTALLLSASPSLRGGAQGLVHLKVPLQALGVFVFPRLFTLSRADEAFAADGALKDANLAAELLQIVTHFTQTTKALRTA
jgi:NAD(P)H-dependent FMN reductase